MSQKKTEIENPPVSKSAEKPNCHIHDKVEYWEDRDEIRENVCVNDEELTEHEGKHYCLFHLPTKKKKIAKFGKIFRARLKAVEDKIAEIEKLPEDEREEAKGKVSYDFRYVWYPLKVNFYKHKFVAFANFNSTTFSADADFSSATFSDRAYFDGATFSDYASFYGATLSASATFSSATFSAIADFISATFSVMANFGGATFSASASFCGATFSAIA